jgi:hypothetical protein
MVQWPLAVAQRQLLSELATLIARGGAWRFLRGPVVAANKTDYPDPWDQTRAGVARVLARTLWHAHAAFDAVLEDARAPGTQQDGLLRNTLLQLAHIDGHWARFALHHIGNDDVAGIAAHEVGRAFAGWIARDGHPFRAIPEDGLPSRETGSLATVYLGLGVIAVNAAYHSRAGGSVTGSVAYHAHAIGRAGGLDVDDLAFLLAVQAEVRDDVLPALASLRPTQTEAVAAWRAVLEDHEDELEQLLGLDDASRLAPAPDRPPAPRPVAIEAGFDETVLTKHNHGRRVFRVAETRLRGHAVVGALLGLIGGVAVLGGLGPVGPGVTLAVGLAPVVMGFAFGCAVGGTRTLYRCATCESFLDAAAADCPACGGTIAGDIANRNQRLDAEEALEAAEHGAPARSSDDLDDAGASDGSTRAPRASSAR